MLCSVAKSCPTLCNPTDYSLGGSSVSGIFQVRILEWVVISPFQGIFLTQKSNLCLLNLLHCRQILYHWATWHRLHFWVRLMCVESALKMLVKLSHQQYLRTTENNKPFNNLNGTILKKKNSKRKKKNKNKINVWPWLANFYPHTSCLNHVPWVCLHKGDCCSPL